MSSMGSDFASVWSRVTGMRPAEDELTKLRRWMGDETEELRAYEMILRSSLPNQVRETLSSILRDKRRHMKELQTLYYLRTGDVWNLPKPGDRRKQPLMKALRERYAAAISLAVSYRDCAAEQRDLASLCAALAQDEDTLAMKLRSLIKRLL